MSFVPLPEAAKRIAEEPDVLVAEEKLCEFLSDHPEVPEDVIWQLDGFWGMDWPDVEHLRVEYRIWKERQAAVKQSEIREKQSEIREKQREVGRQTKNLKRGKTKAAPASGKKSSKPRRKNA